MLTPQELLEIVDTLHPQLDTLNQWITADLISRLMARLGRGEEFLLTGTDQWQLEVYKSAGGHYEALISGKMLRRHWICMYSKTGNFFSADMKTGFMPIFMMEYVTADIR